MKYWTEMGYRPMFSHLEVSGTNHLFVSVWWEY